MGETAGDAITAFVLVALVALTLPAGALLAQLWRGGFMRKASTTITYLKDRQLIAAGAIITVAAETILTEAYERSGAMTGLAALFGFLAAAAIGVVLG